MAQIKSMVMGSWPGSASGIPDHDGSWKPRELPEEEGDDAGVEEGMLVVIAFRDDATG